MEFPECLEEHFHQVVKHLINQTTTELQKLFRHHWTAIPGNKFWEIEIGNELWRSCYKNLKRTSEQRIVKGQINKWSIDDLAELIPEVMQRNGNSSLTKRFSDVLKSIQDLFTPFETTKLFVSFEALSLEEYKRFMSTLAGLLTQLDSSTMTLSSITRDVISVEDLSKVNATVMNIKRETRKSKVFSIVTTLLETYPNLPPYFEEAMFILQQHVREVPSGVLQESLKLFHLDRSNASAHVRLALWYTIDGARNPSLFYYHARKSFSLVSLRDYLFNFLKKFLSLQPKNDPNCGKLRKGLLLLEKGMFDVDSYYLAMDHFKRTMQHGNPLASYAFGLVAILIRDHEDRSAHKAPWFKKVNINFQTGAKMLIDEVKKAPPTLLYKYSSRNTFGQNEKLGQAHFLLGFLYEKGYLSRDLDKAKSLYQTAIAKFNNEMASYCLGSMYYDGDGVRQSYMWAKLYWQHSIIIAKKGWSVYAMVDYYLKHLEFTNTQMLALNMEGFVTPGTKDQERVNYFLVGKINAFMRTNLATRAFSLFRQIYYFEQSWNLTGKGLTLLERLKRAELLGFTHEFGDMIQEIYDIFQLNYGTERNDRGDGGTMSAYKYGVDECLEVDYSRLFSRIYLVSPARIFAVTTFRHNLANDQQPKWKIKYNTHSRDELNVKLPGTFRENGRNADFVVVEDLLFAKDEIYLRIECVVSGAIHQLKLAQKTMIRLEKHLKLEYGAKIALSYLGKRFVSGNTDAFFRETLGPGVDLIVFVMGKEANMCRFCSDPILKVKTCVCGFGYCGQTCLDRDRKYLKHEYLCLPST